MARYGLDLCGSAVEDSCEHSRADKPTLAVTSEVVSMGNVKAIVVLDVTSYSPVEINVTPETFVLYYTASHRLLYFSLYYYEIKMQEDQMNGEHDASLKI
jgi:hypothetical protein